MPPKKRASRRKPPGPTAEHLAITGDWKASVKTALSKKRPKRGWPKHAKGK